MRLKGSAAPPPVARVARLKGELREARGLPSKQPGKVIDLRTRPTLG